MIDLKKVLTISIFLFGYGNLYGQNSEISEDSLVSDKMYFVNNLFTYGENIMKEQGVKCAIDTLKRFEKSIETENDPLKKSFYYQVMMTFYSFINHHNSLTYETKAFPYKKIPEGTLSLDFKAINAIEYIADNLGDSRVILINEAHHFSEHRAFLRDLLPELRKKGFNYLLLEALFEHEDQLKERKYPILTSGLYLNDPVFSQAVRQAYALDYQVVQLERGSENDDREEDQAFRIDSVLRADPTAKVLVFVGHDHINKQPKNGYVRMGNILINKLGYEVPAIELTEMRENSSADFENADYKIAVENFPDQAQPFVVIQNDSSFVSSASKGLVDFNVFFPRTRSFCGLADWSMPNDGKEALLDLSVKKGEIVQVFIKDELEREKNLAIAVIQFEADKAISNLNLRLPLQRYIAKVLNSESVELTSVEFDVK